MFTGKGMLENNEIIMYNKYKNSQGIENVYQKLWEFSVNHGKVCQKIMKLLHITIIEIAGSLHKFYIEKKVPIINKY